MPLLYEANTASKADVTRVEISMYDLGTNALVTKFASLKKAIKAKDCRKAASESNRPHVSSTRNATVKKWLEEAK
jgi:hypothetical protein